MPGQRPSCCSAWAAPRPLPRKPACQAYPDHRPHQGRRKRRRVRNSVTPGGLADHAAGVVETAAQARTTIVSLPSPFAIQGVSKMSLYNVSVPTFVRILTALSAVLDKAATQAEAR